MERAGASILCISDQLRSVIHLRGYAQRDPLNEFKNECFTLFETLLNDLRRAVTRVLMRGQFVVEPASRRRRRGRARAKHGAVASCSGARAGGTSPGRTAADVCCQSSLGGNSA